MHVRSIELRHVRIPLRSPFKHAAHDRRESNAVIVSMTSDDGVRGLGEIQPRAYVTGETVESVLREHAPALARAWLGRSVEDASDLVDAIRDARGRDGHALATLAGFEIAAIDLAGKALGFDAGDLLGPAVGGAPDPGVALGFEVETDSLAERCVLLKLVGRRFVKLKVGRTDDVVRVAVVRDTLGPAASLRVDANGAWTVPAAIDRIRAMQPFGIESVEQPVAAVDLGGMRRVREKSGVPVIADESVCSVDDLRRVIAERAADGINVRLGKCGGLLASKELVDLARAAGLQCGLGTLVGETGILSRAADVFASRVGGFDCIDGRGQHRFLLEEDVVEPHDEGTGLGVRVREDVLERYTASPPRTFESLQGAAS
jgi:L-Ala-D/L-Glu epimerase / N-acetyl-D-glutamate racemase